MARPDLQFRIVQVTWLVLLAAMFQYGHSLKNNEGNSTITPSPFVGKNATR